jgi:hypothetical protein
MHPWVSYILPEIKSGDNELAGLIDVPEINAKKNMSKSTIPPTTIPPKPLKPLCIPPPKSQPSVGRKPTRPTQIKVQVFWGFGSQLPLVPNNLLYEKTCPGRPSYSSGNIRKKQFFCMCLVMVKFRVTAALKWAIDTLPKR